MKELENKIIKELLINEKKDLLAFVENAGTKLWVEYKGKVYDLTERK